MRGFWCWTVYPLSSKDMSSPPIPQNVIQFRRMFFADEISWDEVILEKGGPLIHCDQCPYKEDSHERTVAHKENAMWWQRYRLELHSCKQWLSKIGRKPAETRKRQARRPLQVSGVMALLTSWFQTSSFQTSSFQNCETIHFCCFCPVCGNLL